MIMVRSSIVPKTSAADARRAIVFVGRLAMIVDVADADSAQEKSRKFVLKISRSS